MSEASRREVRAGLEPCLARLWRYALVLSRANDAAEDLVQATCLRAIERADRIIQNRPQMRIVRLSHARRTQTGSLHLQSRSKPKEAWKRL
jgi:hypothetical protein